MGGVHLKGLILGGLVLGDLGIPPRAQQPSGDRARDCSEDKKESLVENYTKSRQPQILGRDQREGGLGRESDPKEEHYKITSQPIEKTRNR
jgi:hypothetical protein